MSSKKSDHRDDWHEETLLRLQKSLIYQALLRKAKSDPGGQPAVSLVQEAVHYSYQRTKAVLRHMGEFTLHDGDHSFRVLHFMERLLSKNALEHLSVPELMLLILTAFFHDIGMGPDEATVVAWKSIWDSNARPSAPAMREEYDKFSRYCSARPADISHIDAFIKLAEFTNAELAKNYLVSDYIRNTHAERAKEIIQKDWEDKIKYRDADLTVEFAALCFSHNQDAQVLLEMEQDYVCGPGVFACLPLVGILLRLSDILDFDGKRTPPVLLSHLFVRHPVSVAEWSKHRSVEAWNISTEQIQYSAKCEHPAIEAAIHDFGDLIDKELSQCNNIAGSLNGSLQSRSGSVELKLPFKMDRSKIVTKKTLQGRPKYLYRRTEFTLSKTQVIDLLMGTKLYGNPQVALRELIQNSIDACLLRRALERSWANEYTPEISITYSSDGADDILEIADNGTGMDQHIIDKFYTKIGSSFYKSAEFYDLKSQTNANFIPTSRFGIGILSAFMVADTMIVDTRRVYAPHDSSEALTLTIEGQESIFWIQAGARMTPGTTTRLVLRPANNPWKNLNEIEFINSVESVLTNPPFKVTIAGGKETKMKNERSFEDVNARVLKNHSWSRNDNIREIELAFTDVSEGFVGSAVVAILEKRKRPVSSLDMTSRTVTIDNQKYTLEKSMRMSGDNISVVSYNITVDDEGDVSLSNSSTELSKSKARISLHGIEVPTNLFPDYWEARQNPVKLEWPFPALLILDVCGNEDLDLNSSRSQILRTDKWERFSAKLTLAVCRQLSEHVSPSYWKLLGGVLCKLSEGTVFRHSMEMLCPDIAAGRRRRRE